MNKVDPYNLTRDLSAQYGVYSSVLRELKAGQKRSHWMWFIFPQIEGLGRSATSKHYFIKCLEEAKRYLSHPVLGKRLLECYEIILGIEGRTISKIFHYPDNLKLQSCITLFLCFNKDNSIFACALNYFDGIKDVRTVLILEKII